MNTRGKGFIIKGLLLFLVILVILGAYIAYDTQHENEIVEKGIRLGVHFENARQFLLIRNRAPMECTFSRSDFNTTITSNLYIDREAVRLDHHINGDKLVIQELFLDSGVYLWKSDEQKIKVIDLDQPMSKSDLFIFYPNTNTKCSYTSSFPNDAFNVPIYSIEY